MKVLPARAAASGTGLNSETSSALSPNNTNLVAQADAYEALDRLVDVMLIEAPGYDDLDADAADTPADSLIGALTKICLCQSPPRGAALTMDMS